MAFSVCIDLWYSELSDAAKPLTLLVKNITWHEIFPNTCIAILYLIVLHIFFIVLTQNGKKNR